MTNTNRERSLKRVLEANEKGILGTPTKCQYFSHEGRMCPVGAMLDDEHRVELVAKDANGYIVSELANGYTVSELAEFGSSVKFNVEEVTGMSIEELSNIQRMHDKTSGWNMTFVVDYVKTELKKLEKATI